MKIKFNAADIDREKWRQFNDDHPEGNIFQSPDMYDLFKGTANNTPLIAVSYDDSDNITGILAGVLQRERGFIKSGLSTRIIIWGGPVVKETEEKPNILRALVGAFLNEYSKKSIYVQIRNFWN